MGAVSAGSGPALKAEPAILRFFISYASEDILIATAVAKALREALGGVFAEVNIDRWFLEAGEEFQKQIEEKLERTDIFISLYTGRVKEWTGWEIGYFERVMRGSQKKRSILAMYLNDLPKALARYQGINLNILEEHLSLSAEEFAAINNGVSEEDAAVRFLLSLQERVDENRVASGFSKATPGENEDPVKCVQMMKLAIFNHLRTKVQVTIKPQKQIQIRTTDTALKAAHANLPMDAELVPVGNGTMSIFGLGGDKPRMWKEFLADIAASEQANSWRIAINSVVNSSSGNRIDVDNSQIVISSDGKNTYRVILTSSVRYYDDKREFTLYLVEALARPDNGDELTTQTLKAIEFACRFRFLFFEKASPFSPQSVDLTDLHFSARKLIRELDWLRKDSSDSKLDQPSVWLGLVKDPDKFNALVRLYQPKEQQLRTIAARILETDESSDLSSLKEELRNELADLKQTVESGNAELIRELTAKLQAAIPTQE
jgi:TIR domain